jgi:VWFA-related protein
MRILSFTLLCGLLAGQQPARTPQSPLLTNAPPAAAQQPASQPPDDQAGYRIPVTVNYVQSLVLVFDRDGGYVNNIRPEQFHLFDNDKEQNFQMDVTYTPISLVLLIQSSAHVEGLLPEVNKIGNMIGPQVIGDAGETAVVAFDARIRVLQDFTTDSSKVAAAVKKIQPGSESNRMVDAVEEGTRLLRSRSKDRRRIMLLIGETRDLGSEAKRKEVLAGLMAYNITFYSVDMSRFITTLTTPPKAARPDPLPPAMHPLPPNVVATPNNVDQMYGTNARIEAIPLMLEIFRDVKAIFVDNPVEAFTKGTGGTEFGFHSQHTLENALTELGEQLHSEYTLSYSPTNRDDPGFHQIRIEIDGHPEVKKIVTRPGYYLGPRP